MSRDPDPWPWQAADREQVQVAMLRGFWGEVLMVLGQSGSQAIGVLALCDELTDLIVETEQPQ